jgi:hypothetical protein
MQQPHHTGNVLNAGDSAVRLQCIRESNCPCIANIVVAQAAMQTPDKEEYSTVQYSTSAGRDYTAVRPSRESHNALHNDGTTQATY